MADALDHLVELTGLRDREVIDRTLTEALFDLLSPQQVDLWVPVGEEGDRRWLCRAARGSLAGPPAQAAGAWTDVASLPALESAPERLQCLRRQQVVQRPGPPARTLLPLMTDLATVGVVDIVSEAPLLRRQLRPAIALLRVYRNLIGLLEYSERDTLTGLLNRKSFDETFLQATVIEAGRQFGDAGSGLDGGGERAGAQRQWLAVLDIDHFKRVNDSFGHVIGDEVLVLVARLMRGTCRYGDRLYRFGGEEFVVLLSAPDEAAAGIALERLRGALEGASFPQVGRVTASIGYSDVRAGDTPQAAFERADRAVYYAKQNGRNQVRSYLALVEAGILEDEGAAGDVELF